MWRWPVVLLISALLVAGMAYDRRTGGEPGRRGGGTATTGESVELARAMAVATPEDALSSTWFCTGGSTAGRGATDLVVVANPGEVEVSGTITAVPSTGRPRTRPLRVPPRGRTVIDLAEMVRAPYVAATLELAGGGMVVEHQVSGPTGTDVAPCATSGSSTWYFASGSTTRDADETLVLFNPFADDASVDIAFATEDGRRTPVAFHGLQVPARSVVAAHVSPVVTVSTQVSAAVVARSGRVVAARRQTFDGTGASTTRAGAAAETHRPKGLSITAGVPRAATTWMFPYGLKDEGAHERYVVYNPSTRQADVDLVVTLDDPERNGRIDPFELTVAPGSFAMVDLDVEDRVATRVGHVAVVVSRNGVEVVAERLLATTDPFPTTDTAVSAGSPLAAPTWVFAAGGSVKGRQQEHISLQNPGANPVEVRLDQFGDGMLRPIDGRGPVSIGPWGSTTVELDEVVDAPSISLVITGSAPIVAERMVRRPRGSNLSTVIGIPLPDGIVAATPAVVPG